MDKFTKRREALLKKLGDLTISSEDEIMDELEEINIKIAVLKREYEKLDGA
jgi:hypothetical protein